MWLCLLGWRLVGLRWWGFRCSSREALTPAFILCNVSNWRGTHAKVLHFHFNGGRLNRGRFHFDPRYISTAAIAQLTFFWVHNDHDRFLDFGIRDLSGHFGLTPVLPLFPFQWPCRVRMREWMVKRWFFTYATRSAWSHRQPTSNALTLSKSSSIFLTSHPTPWLRLIVQHHNHFSVSMAVRISCRRPTFIGGMKHCVWIYNRIRRMALFGQRGTPIIGLCEGRWRITPLAIRVDLGAWMTPSWWFPRHVLQKRNTNKD